jgi:uncharacterized protein (DUF1697 family)
MLELSMAVLVSMLRGVNLGRHNRIKMDALRALYESLGLEDVRTCLQSGNVVFRASRPNPGTLAARIEKKIESSHGIRTTVILRTPAEMKSVIARNPFARRRGIDPSKLVVAFLAGNPDAEACARVAAIKTAPEELHILGRELYIHFPNGMARPKIPWPLIERTLATSWTGRNWNTVRLLSETADEMEQA